MTAGEYKNFKKLAKQDNLRDSMTNMELALTNLGETTAAELHKQNNSQGMAELRTDVNEAGKVMEKAKSEAEKRLRKPIISPENYLDFQSPTKQLKNNRIDEIIHLEYNKNKLIKYIKGE